MIGEEHWSLDRRLWPRVCVCVWMVRMNEYYTTLEGIRTRLWSMISVMTAISPAEGPDLRRTTKCERIWVRYGLRFEFLHTSTDLDEAFEV